MSNLLSAWFRSYAGRGDDDGEAGEIRNHGYYGIAASAVTVFLFCGLAAAVSIWMAFLCAGLALVAFSIGSYLAPESWRVRPNDDAANSETQAAAAAAEAALAQQRRFGLKKAVIDALPTFPYAQKDGADGGDLDLEAGGDETCSVCLDDVQAGDMVRQLPSCKHLFHVECIDMWLHSHRTCPVCRCNLSPPQKVPGKATPAAPAADAEAEQPADGALSEV
ncbi:hypothetical protein EJB05_25068, partial [Eragrostis curvula]